MIRLRRLLSNLVRKLDNTAHPATPDPVEKLELAITTFERASGLTLSLHPLDHNLWPFLPIRRFLHTSAACLLAKKEAHDVCMHFDWHQVRARLREQPESFIKICHAGLLEWVVPVGPPGHPKLVLFAGQGVPGKNLDQLRPVKAEAYLQRPRTARHSLYGPVEEAQARHLLELLEQLGARIERLLEEIQVVPASRRLLKREGDRQRSIERYIQHFHLESIDLHNLAEHLELSPSRTARIVKQLFNRSFSQLLNEMRVRTATNLLQHTQLSVLDVALHSGFEELSTFHRQFRKITGSTPMQCRRAHQPVVPLSISMARDIISPTPEAPATR